MDRDSNQPTLSSLWQAAAGLPVTDELLAWPADLFALTDVILGRSEAYRLCLAPPEGQVWPPGRFPSWPAAVEQAAQQWILRLEDGRAALPDLVLEQWRVLRSRSELPIELLAEGSDWPMCEALLTLHAVSDEACAGLGVALDRSDGHGCVYRAQGRELLARTGSLARIPIHLVRVLPKVRTPTKGNSLRSFSRYVCVRGPSVAVHWHKVPARRTGSGPRSEHVNMLLLPWPLRVRESDFVPVGGSVRPSTEPSGFFRFAPAEALDLDLVVATIRAARQEVDNVDVVVLPESAIEESAIDDLEAVLEQNGVTTLIAGVRQSAAQASGKLPGNWVHVGVSPSLEKARPLSSGRCREWFHVRQNKHHRWSLDESQVFQYHLGGALHPHIRWWEATEIPRRCLHFVELGDEVTLVSLVCEDLSQIDDVVDIIRSVGPTVVVTPLLDGPQLATRWSARYANVLADDPGSAVLTLSSYGMVQRARAHGREPSPVVALWKDPVKGLREIPLSPGSEGVLLTVCTARSTRRTIDGRLPVKNTVHAFDVATHQVRASRDGAPLGARSAPTLPSLLAVDVLTVLAGWAEGVAEALAYAPARAAHVLAAAREGAFWREPLGLPEPCDQLREAIASLTRVVRTIVLDGETPGVDAFLARQAADDTGEGQHGLDPLIRRVLRSAVEQLRTRRATDQAFA
jgi:hypothetical protein